MTVTFRIPMTARFRRVTERAGVLLRGPMGWGEFSPFPEYPDTVAHRWWLAALEATVALWPPPVRTSIPINVTIPAVGPEEAHERVRASGCTTAKVKVAEGDDAARLEAVRDALGPEGKLRMDVNGAWDTATAIREIRRFSHLDLEYVEQPCASTEDLAAVRKAVDVPIAADESIRLADDPMEVVTGEAADIAILKVQPLGGVTRSLELAEQLGLPAVVSSALETSVGLAAGLHLAACLPELPFACGLGTIGLLEHDVVADPLVPVNGVMELRRPEPELGLVGDPPGSDELIDRLQRAMDAG
ncbi:MAG: o-succinylbenzoate synthase [Actinobacteria bacterium]|nr:o-succinylbenzoate synthase [Actinomycetota bacterium]